MSIPSIAVAILNYNGKEFLQKFLPTVLQNSPQATIYIIDNASTDDSVLFLQQHYPTLRLVVLTQNYGFAGGYNKGLEAIEQITTQHAYYVLLNSDVEVTPNWLAPMYDYLQTNAHVAACQPKILDYTNKNYFEYAGAAGGYMDNLGYVFCRGRIFETLEQDTGQYQQVKEIFWASGAALFIRKNAYWEVDGLDADFFAHMEEIDLCWRLRNKGHSLVYIPTATVYHVGGGTLNKQSPFKTYLNFRNNLVLLHKNLPKNQLIYKLFFRMLLDGLAALKMGKDKGWRHFIAVFKAHIDFYKTIPSTNKKRKAIQPKTSHKGWYTSSILWKYYIEKKTILEEQ